MNKNKIIELGQIESSYELKSIVQKKAQAILHAPLLQREKNAMKKNLQHESFETFHYLAPMYRREIIPEGALNFQCIMTSVV